MIMIDKDKLVYSESTSQGRFISLQTFFQIGKWCKVTDSLRCVTCNFPNIAAKNLKKYATCRAWPKLSFDPSITFPVSRDRPEIKCEVPVLKNQKCPDYFRNISRGLDTGYIVPSQKI